MGLEPISWLSTTEHVAAPHSLAPYGVASLVHSDSDDAAKRDYRIWCPRPESNRHALRREILSLLRLPIPPPGRGCIFVWSAWSDLNRQSLASEASGLTRFSLTQLF